MSDHGAPRDAVSRLLAALGLVLTHRWFILAINLATIYIMLRLFHYYAGYFDGAPDHTHELCESLVGVGVIMIGWGVALEERHSLRHIFRMPGLEDPQQGALDHLCHNYGVGLLIMGLFSEILVEFVRLPNAIIDTSGYNALVLGASDAMLGVCLIFLATFSWSLVAGRRAQA